MKKQSYIFFLLIVLSLILSPNAHALFSASQNGTPPGTQVVPVFPTGGQCSKDSLQMCTFTFITVTPRPPTPTPTQVPPTIQPLQPTSPIVPTSQSPLTSQIPPNSQVSPPNLQVPNQPPASPIPISSLKIGGSNSTEYCIDDEDPDMCDDNSSHLVPKGVGGAAGSCGTIIEQTHKLVSALPQKMKGLRDSLERAVTNCGYTAGPESGYVSTYLVIDSFNLAGFKELSKTNPAHVSPSGLLSWWQSNIPGYVYVPYSPTVIQEWAQGKRDLTGCVMFFKGAHIGVVNKFEMTTPGGDGVLSILQSGYNMYIDRFLVTGWNVDSNSTNQTSTAGIEGFGCHS